LTKGLESLLKHVSLLAEKLPQDTVFNLALALAESRDERMRGKLMTLAATSASKELYQELDRLWAKVPDLDCQSLSLILKSACQTFAHSAEIQKVSIVWTGPATEAVPLRRTEQALKELIDGAKSELLIVSFVAYKIEEIMAALREALSRGTRLRMVFETEEESGGKVSFDQVRSFQKLLPEAKIFTWPLKNRNRDSSGHYGSIHAKCAVADRDVALVSSANLTGFALELNMELGLVIKGGHVARSIAEHFDELIRRDVLIQVR
jgi:phosphatidylserine/phosphatidylglycerophosphate/cardiolipin synthase-like enzyme